MFKLGSMSDREQLLVCANFLLYTTVEDFYNIKDSEMFMLVRIMSDLRSSHFVSVSGEEMLKMFNEIPGVLTKFTPTLEFIGKNVNMFGNKLVDDYVEFLKWKEGGKC